MSYSFWITAAFLQDQFGVRPRGVMIKTLDNRIVVCEFKLQLRYGNILTSDRAVNQEIHLCK